MAQGSLQFFWAADALLCCCGSHAWLNPSACKLFSCRTPPCMEVLITPNFLAALGLPFMTSLHSTIPSLTYIHAAQGNLCGSRAQHFIQDDQLARKTSVMSTIEDHQEICNTNCRHLLFSKALPHRAEAGPACCQGGQAQEGALPVREHYPSQGGELALEGHCGAGEGPACQWVCLRMLLGVCDHRRHRVHCGHVHRAAHRPQRAAAHRLRPRR